ncbi:MAG: secondary thiamine-phosphate synthase enzyme YjbQ [Candidatus Aenigmatarchaeota archaeon]
MFRENIEIETLGGMSFVDITDKIVSVVKKSDIKDGLCSIFLPATTAGLLINENEIMLMEDFKKLFSVVDEKRMYNHPDNAFSHMRALLAATEKTMPVENGNLVLGKLQKILLAEFDTGPRKRSVIVTLIGDEKKDKKKDKSQQE